MKILYAIQGIGNGHVSRAREIIPHLKKYGELDLLLSGTQSEVNLNDALAYQFKGFGFIFGDRGGVDLKKTLQQFEIRRFLKDCKNLPVYEYDFIINDFEPVTAWACRLQKKSSISLSHQSAFLSKRTPQLKGFHWGKQIMNYYAPTTSKVAFHFQRYDDFIFTPVIRSEIRNLNPENYGHYTVYLPAYSDAFIVQQVRAFPEIQWEIFSKHSKVFYENEHVKIYPIDNQKFQKSLEKCCGLLTGGGFEEPAEALFLKKKLLSVLMKNQYEQQCNSLALEEMGVPVIWREADFALQLKKWVNEDRVVCVDYPNQTSDIIASIFNPI